MKKGRIRVGIGGWVYEPWRQTFYPPDLPKTRELAHASRAVSAIEINATFYRMQAPSTFANWAAQAPDDFVFAVKASRYACNRKNLGEAGDAIERFLGSGLTGLGPKLGPILWQLAASKKYDAAEIDNFLSLLPRERDGVALRHAIEPRHLSFQCAAFVADCRRHSVAIVLADSDDYPLIADQTAPFCYLRLQRSKTDCLDGYPDDDRIIWRDRINDLAAGHTARDLPLLAEPEMKPISRDCFAFFIAGAKERNPAAAQAMQRAIERESTDQR